MARMLVTKGKLRITLMVVLGALLLAIIGVGSLWVSYGYHSSREGAPSHILLVGLDSRSAEDAGLPDSLTLIELSSGDIDGI